MAIPFGNATNYLQLSTSDFKVIEGPNFNRQVEGGAVAEGPDGKFEQENAGRVKVSGNSKYYVKGTGALPTEGLFTLGTTTTKVWIDSVAKGDQTKSGHETVTVSFHFFEDLTNDEAVRSDFGLA
jgi:hypothetical protein